MVQQKGVLSLGDGEKLPTDSPTLATMITFNTRNSVH